MAAQSATQADRGHPRAGGAHFVAAVVGPDLLVQQNFARMAAQYVADHRVLAAPGEPHAQVVRPVFDSGASAGRALAAVEALRTALD